MPAKNIVWNPRDALFGLALAVPGAALILSGNVKPGIALLVGVLAAAGVGVPPTRNKRISILVVAVLFAVSIVLGASLAPWPAGNARLRYSAAWGNKAVARLRWRRWKAPRPPSRGVW